MAETVVEKQTCEKCGADVREGTTFCYNCGAAVTAEEAAEPPAEVSANGSEKNAVKRSRAATERKKARVSQRKTLEYTWQPIDDVTLPLIVSIIIAGVVLVIAFLLVFWK